MANSSTDKDASGWSIYNRLLAYSARYWHYFLISLLGFAAYAGTQSALAHMMKYFVDGLESKDADLVTFIPLAVIAISVVRGVGFFLGNYFMSRVSLNVVNDLRKQMFDHMMVLPSTFHDQKNSGELVSMITYNVNQVTNAATNAIKVLFREGLTVIALLAYLLYQNWQLTLIFLLVTPVLAGLIVYTSKLFRRMSEKMQSSMGKVTHVSNEAIQGYRLVRSYGGEDYEKQRFHDASNSNTRQGLKFSRIAAIQTPVFTFLLSLAIAALMFLVLYMASETSAGELVAYVVAAGLLAKPVRQLSEVNSSIQRGIAASESIFDLLDTAAEEDAGKKTVGRVSGAIEFSEVCFSYESGKPVLQDINLTIAPGETVALVGRSGSGKSTLAALLMRFYEIDSGKILLDGLQLPDFQMDSLREQMALVNQQVVLFNDTVASNIGYGQLANADMAAIEVAARDASALEFINDLPEGMNTVVGEDGTRLSGGQRQRLSIARALLKDAPILILDEATSALDTESERSIQKALENVMKGRTTIVIAHRLSTIERADRIVVMDQGRIVEQGKHEDLLAKSGYYSMLQSADFK
ncbi:lipid A export permease/ATP-binding protein MsbA [Oceanicoccus sagamiensis]|uniref:Lipid A export permease/ATP-binding protein MsbA n=1 Tax=Oceanicoccus sagamiensis TaxID=716816 RepID=A0A1X9N719_9GAMM|nr:lipid A export permease/ATP-binding protein MsbA [Oceanicoccus sagamiensis]ARN73888.1 lipid A export permease/ATP-binding protein MsbA [Oceanicoccus sagamiensis]